MSFELTGNLLIDTREKNHDVMAEVGRKWNEVSGGTAITFGLGLRGGDYGLEVVDTETGETKAHPEFRAEAKWMSGSGPTDLFRSTSAYYKRLKHELESFADRHKHTIFICQGKASDLLRHNTPGKITWEATLTRIFWLNAKFRVPFIFADKATSWLTAWFHAGSQFEGEKALHDINKPRPYQIFTDPMKLESALHKSVVPGTQFFCGFQAPKQKRQDLRYSRWMVARDVGFWFLDFPNISTKEKEGKEKLAKKLEKIAERWAQIEKHESALRAVGGFPAVPENYSGYLPTLDDYTPSKDPAYERKRRHPVVVFSDQGDRPLIIMFEVPKKRGVEIQVMLPILANGKPLDLGAVQKPSDAYYCRGLFKVKSTTKTEFAMIPAILHRCRRYWGQSETIEVEEKAPCSEESETKLDEPEKSSEEVKAEPQESAPAAQEADKSSPSTLSSEETLPPAPPAEEVAEAEDLDSINSDLEVSAEPIEEELEEPVSQDLPAMQEPANRLNAINPGEYEKALLATCGLANAAPAMQLVALNMANRYGFSLDLGHIVPIQNKLYITRDGLLNIAHRSGQFDGMEVVDSGSNNKNEWWAKVSVFRKDMKRPFTYIGRYSGSNRKYGPEMAIVRAECMAMRRAFDVSMCSKEEIEFEKFQEIKDPAPSNPVSSQVESEPGDVIDVQATLAQDTTAPVRFDSEHKDSILEALKAAQLPLDPYMEKIAHIYGEKSWDSWRPIESTAASARAFLRILRGAYKFLGEGFVQTLIKEQIIPRDLAENMADYFVNYLKEHCTDFLNPEHFEEVFRSGLDNLASMSAV